MRDVINSLNDDHAYTTVMTTMDRLFQKGLLRRETTSRAYAYRPVLTMCQLETQVARDLITAFLACGQNSPTPIASALVDAVYAHDPDLLEELADEIRSRQSVRLERRVAHSRFRESEYAAYPWPLGIS